MRWDAIGRDADCSLLRFWRGLGAGSDAAMGDGVKKSGGGEEQSRLRLGRLRAGPLALRIFVAAFPGAAPQADIERAFGPECGAAAS